MPPCQNSQLSTDDQNCGLQKMSDIDFLQLLEDLGGTPPWPDGADHACTNQQPMEHCSQTADYFDNIDASPSQGLLASFNYTDPSLTSSISTSPENPFRTDSTSLEEQDLDAFEFPLLPEDMADFDLFPHDVVEMWPSGSVGIPWDFSNPHQSGLAMDPPFTDSGTSLLQNPPHISLVLDHEEAVTDSSRESTQSDQLSLMRTPCQPRGRSRESLPRRSRMTQYMCDICNGFSSGFQSRKDLKRHKRLHKPAALRVRYYCTVRPSTCKKNYTREDNLRRHYREDHGLSNSEALSQLVIEGPVTATQ